MGDDAQTGVQDPNFRRPPFIRRVANRCLSASPSRSLSFSRRLIRLPVETHLIEIPTFRARPPRGIVPRGTPHELRLISASNVQYSNYPRQAPAPNENVCK